MEDLRALISRFLEIQQRRAQIYASLQRGFTEYLESNTSELAYQELCGKLTAEFNDCSRQVVEIEKALRDPSHSREDLAGLLNSVQSHEKTKLQMTVTLQLLKRAGHPNEKTTTGGDAQSVHRSQHPQCRCSSSSPSEELNIISGLEECEAEAEYLAAHKEALTCLETTVHSINDLVETIRYEMED